MKLSFLITICALLSFVLLITLSACSDSDKTVAENILLTFNSTSVKYNSDNGDIVLDESGQFTGFKYIKMLKSVQDRSLYITTLHSTTNWDSPVAYIIEGDLRRKNLLAFQCLETENVELMVNRELIPTGSAGDRFIWQYTVNDGTLDDITFTPWDSSEKITINGSAHITITVSFGTAVSQFDIYTGEDYFGDYQGIDLSEPGLPL